MNQINELVDTRSDLEELQDIIKTSKKNREHFWDMVRDAKNTYLKNATDPELLEIFSKL